MTEDQVTSADMIWIAERAWIAEKSINIDMDIKRIRPNLSRYSRHFAYFYQAFNIISDILITSVRNNHGPI